MSQTRIEAFLTELSTNGPLRRQFKFFPADVLNIYGFSEDEKRTLKTLDWKPISEYINQAFQKRLSFLKANIPGVCILLGDALETTFSAFCERFPVKAKTSAQQEALQFIEYLTFYSDYPIPGYPYANDVLDFENTRLEVTLNASLSSRYSLTPSEMAILEGDEWKLLKPRINEGLLLKRYAYPIDRIIRKLTSTEKVHPDPDETWVIFLRRRKNGKTIARGVAATTRLLITRCDGRTPIYDILERIRNEVLLTGKQLIYFEHDCRHFLKKLAQEGLLELVD